MRPADKQWDGTSRGLTLFNIAVHQELQGPVSNATLTSSGRWYPLGWQKKQQGMIYTPAFKKMHPLCAAQHNKEGAWGWKAKAMVPSYSTPPQA